LKTEVLKDESSMLNNKAYTLIETIIALSILAIIGVPVLSMVYRNNLAVKAEQSIVAIGLLEQEACRIMVDPDECLPLKKRTVNNREWSIWATKEGTDVISYHLYAELDTKVRAELCFLNYAKKGL
jgi:prepilin-type N-terminal cleavage/methylation domain-containing protein